MAVLQQGGLPIPRHEFDNVQADGRRAPRRHERQWNVIFGRMVELVARSPTHVHRGLKTFSAIDRVFTACPTWLLKQTWQQAEADADGRKLQADSAVPLRMSGARELISAYAAAAALDSFAAHPPTMLDLHTRILQEVGARMRDRRLQREPNSKASRAMVFRCMARCIWRQDYNFAARLIHVRSWLSEFVEVRPGRVLLVDGAAFHAAHDRAQRADLLRREARRGQLAPGGPPSPAQAGPAAPAPLRQQLAGQRRAHERRMKLWSPFGKRVVNTPSERAAALAAHRAPVFSSVTPVDERAAQRCLDRLSPRLAPEQLAGWGAEEGSNVLAHALRWMTLGRPIGARFARALAVFPPKGTREADKDGVVRPASDARPLALKQCSNKVLASAVHLVLAKIIAPVISPIQRGFMRGRNFLHNVLDLDTFSHIASFGPEALMVQPLLLSFDFAQAFAALSQRWLFLSLRALGLPIGILYVLAMFYFDAQMFEESHAGLTFLFIVNSGVLQGCPLSGDLYAIGTNVFLIDLAASLEERRLGIARACADDLGAIAYGPHGCRVLARVLGLCRRLAGLTLKISKRAAALACLAAADAAWAAFDIAEQLLYLSVILGVNVSLETQWAPQLAAWRERAGAISKTGSCFYTATALYHRHAIPVLGYKGQLFPLPWNLTRDEMHIHSRLFHWPANSLTRADWHVLEDFGAPALTSANVCVAAVRLRAVLTTLAGWEANLTLLRRSAKAHLPTAVSAQGRCAASWRSDAPLVLHLRAASEGLNDSPKLCAAGLAALDHARELLQSRSAAMDGGSLAAPGGKLRLQGALLRTLHTSVFTNDLASTMTRRMRRWHPSVETPEALDWEALAGDLRRLPQAWRMALLRTWARAWPTAARLQSRDEPCIFGCPAGADSMVHYDERPRLRGAAERALGHALAPSAHERLALDTGATSRPAAFARARDIPPGGGRERDITKQAEGFEHIGEEGAAWRRLVLKAIKIKRLQGYWSQLGQYLNYVKNVRGRFSEWLQKVNSYVISVFGVGFKAVIEWAVDQANDSVALTTAAAVAQFVDEAIDGEEVDAIDEKLSQLYALSISLTEGESFGLVVSAGQVRGAEALRLLVRRWGPTSGGRRRVLLKKIMAPNRAAKLENLAGEIAKWEELIRRCERARLRGRDVRPDDEIKMSALESLVSQDVELHLALNRTRLNDYPATRGEARSFLGARQALEALGRARGGPMDVDAFVKGHSRGKGGEGDLDNFEETNRTVSTQLPASASQVSPSTSLSFDAFEKVAEPNSAEAKPDRKHYGKIIATTFDTGAAATAFPPGQEGDCTEPDGNYYRIATGEIVQLNLKGRRANIRKPLLSALAAASKGHFAWIGAFGGYLLQESEFTRKILHVIDACVAEENKGIVPLYLLDGICKMGALMDAPETRRFHGASERPAASGLAGVGADREITDTSDGESRPTKAEFEQHEATGHAACRDWREVCCAARGVGQQHELHGDPREGADPVASIDFAFMGEKAGEEEDQEDNFPMLVARDSKTKPPYSSAVPGKKVTNFTVKILMGVILHRGYRRLIVQSDGEAAISALKTAVAAAPPAVEFSPRESPPGADGISAEQRWLGRDWKKLEAEFGGERAMHRPPAPSGRRSAMKGRMKSGNFLGYHMRTGALLATAVDGVEKGQGFKRLPKERAWGGKDWDALCGVPWATRPVEEAGATPRTPLAAVPSMGPRAPRARCALRRDIEKCGATAGRMGCQELMQKGKTMRAHAEGCRERIAEMMKGDPQARSGSAELLYPSQVEPREYEVVIMELREFARIDYSAEDMEMERFAEMTFRFGLAPGPAVDIETGWDLRLPAQRKARMEQLARQDPLLTVTSPPCTSFTNLRKFSDAKRDPKVVEAEILEGETHLNLCMRICKERYKAEKLFLREAPWSASSWCRPSVQGVIKMENVFLLHGPMCRWHMEAIGPGGKSGFVRNVTGWFTNSELLANIVEGYCECPHPHEEESEVFVEYQDDNFIDDVTGDILDCEGAQAHFYGDVRRVVYVELPEEETCEDPEPVVGKLFMATHGAVLSRYGFKVTGVMGSRATSEQSAVYLNRKVIRDLGLESAMEVTALAVKRSVMDVLKVDRESQKFDDEKAKTYRSVTMRVAFRNAEHDASLRDPSCVVCELCLLALCTRRCGHRGCRDYSCLTLALPRNGCGHGLPAPGQAENAVVTRGELNRIIGDIVREAMQGRDSSGSTSAAAASSGGAERHERPERNEKKDDPWLNGDPWKDGAIDGSSGWRDQSGWGGDEQKGTWQDWTGKSGSWRDWKAEADRPQGTLAATLVLAVLGGKNSKGNPPRAADATQAFLRARQARIRGERAPGEPDSDGYIWDDPADPSMAAAQAQLEDFGEKLDTIEDRILNAEQGIGQLGFMLQQIGPGVAALLQQHGLLSTPGGAVQEDPWVGGQAGPAGASGSGGSPGSGGPGAPHQSLQGGGPPLSTTTPPLASGDSEIELSDVGGGGQDTTPTTTPSEAAMSQSQWWPLPPIPEQPESQLEQDSWEVIADPDLPWCIRAKAEAGRAASSPPDVKRARLDSAPPESAGPDPSYPSVPGPSSSFEPSRTVAERVQDIEDRRARHVAVLTDVPRCRLACLGAHSCSGAPRAPGPAPAAYLGGPGGAHRPPARGHGRPARLRRRWLRPAGHQALRPVRRRGVLLWRVPAQGVEDPQGSVQASGSRRDRLPNAARRGCALLRARCAAGDGRPEQEAAGGAGGSPRARRRVPRQKEDELSLEFSGKKLSMRASRGNHGKNGALSHDRARFRAGSRASLLLAVVGRSRMKKHCLPSRCPP
ncbi:unnamed protein product, partial [Prorocentrum cordatum]